jgi:hypothetical protein
MNNVVTFRFTVLGFYLAAIGLIVSRDSSQSAAALLVGITLAVWIIDLRNRSLLANICSRGIEIEREEWGLRGQRAYAGFFSRMMKIEPKSDPQAPKRPDVDPSRVFGITLPIRIPFTQKRIGVISHTLALNILYLSVLSYCIWSLLHP